MFSLASPLKSQRIKETDSWFDPVFFLFLSRQCARTKWSLGQNDEALFGTNGAMGLSRVVDQDPKPAAQWKRLG